MSSSAPCLHVDDWTGKKCWNHVVRGTGYCEEHQKPAWFGSSWNDDKPKNWGDITRNVMNRDKGVCYICGNLGTEIEHKTPKHLGGTNDLWNLAVVCHTCHLKKTLKEAEEAKAAMKARKRY